MIDILHDELHERLRVKRGTGKEASPGPVDSPPVKTASVTADKGLAGNKKVSGRKRFLLPDGWRIGVLIGAADVGAGAGAEEVFFQRRERLPSLKKVLAAQGFDGVDEVAGIESLFGFIFEIVNRVWGVSGFQVLPERWIEERACGRLTGNRRSVKDYEELPEVSRAFIHSAMIRLMLKQLAP